MKELVCEKEWKKYTYLKILSIIILAFLMSVCTVGAEPFAYITNYNDSSLSVIDTENNTIIATVAVGAGPWGAAISPDGTNVYVTNYDENTTSVIDMTTNKVTATINVGQYPNAIAFTPDGTKAYVADDSISVIDTTTNRVKTKILVGSSPVGVAVNPEGTEVYVTNSDINTVSVIDTGTNKVIANVLVGIGPWGLSVTPDGKEVYVANNDSNTVSVIDTTSDAVTATIPVGVGPGGVAISPDGTEVYVTNGLDNTVSVINTETNKITAIIPVGDAPLGVAAISDGTEVYVANLGSNNLSIINTSKKQVTESIQVGNRPYDVVIQPTSTSSSTPSTSTPSTSTPELSSSYFTTVISSIYNMYSQLGIPLVSHNITNTGVNAFEVTVSSEITGYTDEVVDKQTIQPGQTVQIPQAPLFKPGILSTLNEKKGANLHYKIIRSENGVEQSWDEKTIPIELYAKDTMVLGYADPSGEFYTMDPFLVAWVTPHANEIDRVIRVAAEYLPDRAIGGAQTPEERFKQVEAIYYALKNKYDITYVNSPLSYPNNNMESTQRIKLPKDAINLKSANCIEGTVIFASALESIEMEPYIILVPGHAFLVWGDGQGNLEGALETTLIGSSDFEYAVKAGADEYSQEENNGNFSNNVSKIISVKEWRDLGITPIDY